MPQYLVYLVKAQLALFLIAQLALLFVQGAALRRHGQRSFQLLVASTVCGVFVILASAAMVIFTPTERLLAWCYSLGFIFGSGQAGFGIAGAVLLFRDYRCLTEHFTSTRPPVQ